MSDSLAQVPSWQLGSDGFMYNDSKNNNNRLIIIIMNNNNNKKKKTKIFTIRQDLHVFMYIIYMMYAYIWDHMGLSISWRPLKSTYDWDQWGCLM